MKSIEGELSPSFRTQTIVTKSANASLRQNPTYTPYLSVFIVNPQRQPETKKAHLSQQKCVQICVQNCTIQA